MPCFTANEAIWINARVAHGRAEGGEGDRREQGRFAVSIVRKEEIEIRQPRRRHPIRRKVSIPVAE